MTGVQTCALPIFVITVFVFERAVGPLELRNNIILYEISRLESDPIACVIQRGKKRSAEVLRSVNTRRFLEPGRNH